MQSLFAFLALASMLGILLGLIKPTLVLHWGAKRTRLRALGWYSLFTVVFLVAVGMTPTARDFSTGFAEGYKEGMGQQPAEKPQIATAEEAPQAAAPAPVPTPVKAAPAKAQAPAEAEDKEQTFKVGMEVPVGKLVYTVTSVKFARRLGNSAFNETADGVFLVVGMTILNKDTETRTLDGSMFKIKDAAATEYEHSTRGSTAVELSGGKTLFLKQCQPKIPTKGTLVFEVPDQSQPYLLELSGGFWSGKSAQVALQ